MNLESLLPREQRLDDCMDTMIDAIDEEIEALRLRQPGSDVIDIELEFNHTGNVAYLTSVSEALVGDFIENRATTDDSRETHESVYRAVLFAYQVAMSIYGTDTKIRVSTYLAELMGADDPRANFEQDIHDFLSDNQYVDAFIGAYVDDIDETRNQLAAVELATGMIFMLYERKNAELYVQEQFASAEPSYFE